MKDYYIKKYGVNIDNEISILLEEDDTIKLNAIKMLLANLANWWGLCFDCEQEELEYNKLKEVIEKLNELIKMRNDYINEWEEELKDWQMYE